MYGTSLRIVVCAECLLYLPDLKEEVNYCALIFMSSMARFHSKTKVTNTLLQPYMLLRTWVGETDGDGWHCYELNVPIYLVQCEIPLLYVIFYHKRTQPY
jgi:hypothetical protein